jgi:hypothetical protein
LYNSEIAEVAMNPDSARHLPRPNGDELVSRLQRSPQAVIDYLSKCSARTSISEFQVGPVAKILGAHLCELLESGKAGASEKFHELGTWLLRIESWHNAELSKQVFDFCLPQQALSLFGKMVSQNVPVPLIEIGIRRNAKIDFQFPLLTSDKRTIQDADLLDLALAHRHINVANVLKDHLPERPGHSHLRSLYAVLSPLSAAADIAIFGEVSIDEMTASHEGECLLSLMIQAHDVQVLEYLAGVYDRDAGTSEALSHLATIARDPARGDASQALQLLAEGCPLKELCGKLEAYTLLRLELPISIVEFGTQVGSAPALRFRDTLRALGNAQEHQCTLPYLLACLQRPDATDMEEVHVNHLIHRVTNLSHAEIPLLRNTMQLTGQLSWMWEALQWDMERCIGSQNDRSLLDLFCDSTPAVPLLFVAEKLGTNLEFDAEIEPGNVEIGLDWMRIGGIKGETLVIRRADLAVNYGDVSVASFSPRSGQEFLPIFSPQVLSDPSRVANMKPLLSTLHDVIDRYMMWRYNTDKLTAFHREAGAPAIVQGGHNSPGFEDFCALVESAYARGEEAKLRFVSRRNAPIFGLPFMNRGRLQTELPLTYDLIEDLRGLTDGDWNRNLELKAMFVQAGFAREGWLTIRAGRPG